MALNIPEEIHGRVKISAIDDTVFLSGEIDQLNPASFLKPFFKKIEDQMDDHIILDIRNLIYLNSSGIRCIITFLIARQPETTVVFLRNKDVLWQHNSLEIIKEIDSPKISIQE